MIKKKMMPIACKGKYNTSMSFSGSFIFFISYTIFFKKRKKGYGCGAVAVILWAPDVVGTQFKTATPATAFTASRVVVPSLNVTNPTKDVSLQVAVNTTFVTLAVALVGFATNARVACVETVTITGALVIT
jgi:hypothetical protein